MIAGGFCGSSSAKAVMVAGLSGFAELAFLMFAEIVHVEVAVVFEPVFVVSTAKARTSLMQASALGKMRTTRVLRQNGFLPRCFPAQESAFPGPAN